MTDKVLMSPGRAAEGYEFAQTLDLAGPSDEGWVVPTNTEKLASDQGLSGTPLNAFGESHSTSSFDVTIDTGEGFVGGSWLGRDTTTTVTMSSSTNNQAVYVGWNKGKTNTVIIGKSGAFGTNDPKMKIWEFDTDGSGVTASEDFRDQGQRVVLPVGTDKFAK